MNSDILPFVSIVTPVYNGEKYLVECIESVLFQSYDNWEYIIVNNQSTDRTLEIAERYAQRDSRIRVVNNEDFLPMMENWNHALQQISEDSEFCKVVHADDWLFPRCLEEMVEVGRANPSIGLVGSYGLWGNRVVCDGLSYPREFISGRELCRLTLLGELYLFWSPTSLLIRSDLIRKRQPFYNGPHLHADVEMCYEVLLEHDFGFVHQVLSFIRRHEESVTSTVASDFNQIVLNNLDLFIRYGKIFLNNDEYKKRLKHQLDKYYVFLASSVLALRQREFWGYHANRTSQIGVRLSYLKLMGTLFIMFITRPKRSMVQLFKSLIRKFD